MRPLSEVAQALLSAANRLSAAGRAVTQAEMAAGAGMVKLADIQNKKAFVPKRARIAVSNLKRRGHLKIVGERRVSYRNRPVKEYAPAVVESEVVCPAPAGADLGRCLHAWAR